MSNKYTDEQVAQFNQELEGKSPAEIVAWAIIKADKPVITTNFRPYEGAILHVVTSVKPTIDVVWCDTGYNTRNTYKQFLAVLYAVCVC